MQAIARALESCEPDLASGYFERILAEIVAMEALETVDEVVGSTENDDELDETWDQADEPELTSGEHSAPHEESVNPLRRAALLGRMLLDLYEAGWTVVVEDGQLYLLAPIYTAEDGQQPEDVKRALRSLLLPRVAAKLANAKPFIEEMEAQSADEKHSISMLIADGEVLAEVLRTDGVQAIKPYVQPARPDDGLDQTTGLRLWDIFRYLRFHWSFPYETTPGRTLPMLIRDAGQPNHPVCGLLCLTSPVLRLTVRDTALGWTPSWLEAVVAGLDFELPKGEPTASLREHFSSLRDQLTARRSAGTTPLVPSRVVSDISALLNLEPTADPIELARKAQRLPEGELIERSCDARRRLTGALIGEISSAISKMYLGDLDVDLERALASPLEAASHLEEVGAKAREAWASSREAGANSSTTEQQTHLLFVKKRAVQLARYLKAWDDLQPLRCAAAEGDAALMAALRADAGGRKAPWSDDPSGLTDGRGVSRGLRSALPLRLTRLMASQVADVSVCGSIPPYNDLLGGKLAGLLALSREVSATWHSTYSGFVSAIQSRMEGREVLRPATIIALTTTSFYPVGSAQYNRLQYPGGPGWARVGSSSGHGTLHFSDATSKLAQGLLRSETGRHLITSTFGEGPSEKMRKLRDALSRLGLPADELLRHGMSRLVYVADIDLATRPGFEAHGAPHHEVGPTAVELSEHWRSRWLRGRISRPDRLARLSELRPSCGLISAKYPELFGSLDDNQEGGESPCTTRS